MTKRKKKISSSEDTTTEDHQIDSEEEFVEDDDSLPHHQQHQQSGVQTNATTQKDERFRTSSSLLLSLNSFASFPNCVKVSPSNTLLALVTTTHIFVYDLRIPTREVAIIRHNSPKQEAGGPPAIFRSAEWSPASCPHLHRRQLLLTLDTSNQLLLYSFTPSTSSSSLPEPTYKLQQNISEQWSTKYKKKQRVNVKKYREIDNHPNKKQKMEEMEFFRANDHLSHMRAMGWSPVSYYDTQKENVECCVYFAVGGKSHITFWRVSFDPSSKKAKCDSIIKTHYVGYHSCHENTYVTAIQWCSVPQHLYAAQEDAKGLLFSGGADGSVRMSSLFIHKPSEKKYKIEARLMRVILQTDLSFVSLISPLNMNNGLMVGIEKSNQIIVHEYDQDRTVVVNHTNETSSLLTGLGWVNDCLLISTDRNGNMIKWMRKEATSEAWSCEILETSEHAAWGVVVSPLSLYLIYFQSSDSKHGKLSLLPLSSSGLPCLFSSLGDRIGQVAEAYWEIVRYLRDHVDEYQPILSALEEEECLLSLRHAVERGELDQQRDNRLLAKLRIGVVIRSQIGLLRRNNKREEVERIEETVKAIQQYNVLKKLLSFLNKVESDSNNGASTMKEGNNLFSTSMLLCCKWLERSIAHPLSSSVADSIARIYSIFFQNHQQTQEVCSYCGTEMDITGMFPQETCANGHPHFRCAVSMTLVGVTSPFVRCDYCNTHIVTIFRNPAQLVCPLCHAFLD
eukprot:TRINITY_DN13970_c0_g1_i2.p1 TRINITY_DN13970_c0_g1~~TRINITY_DN13970_c0_g1_i2.p1  ORF type:complete len:734 (-),score=90.26 TRINITY_DN13970_c0_g1_i2:40-2241(-)